MSTDFNEISFSWQLLAPWTKKQVIASDHPENFHHRQGRLVSLSL